MRWKVRYLIGYRDRDRWGESQAYNSRNAYDWVRLAPKDILEVMVYMGPKLMGHWKRNSKHQLIRVWGAA